MTPPEFLHLIRQAVGDGRDLFALGTVDEAHTTGAPRVRFDDEDVASVRTRPYLSGYTPTAGDRVLLGRVGNGWVVLGAVTT